MVQFDRRWLLCRALVAASHGASQDLSKIEILFFWRALRRRYLFTYFPASLNQLGIERQAPYCDFEDRGCSSNLPY